jgi:nicotinamidase-related amidase
MPLLLDNQRTALLCLHLQNDIVDEKGALALAGFGSARMVAKHGVLARVARLQDAARNAGVKVYHVAVWFRPDYSDAPPSSPLLRACIDATSLIEGTWGAGFPASVAPKAEDVVVVNKATGAFTTSDLRDRLPSGIDTLLLAGVATNFVVESTAREAGDLGYEAVVVSDCCMSVSEEMHEAALRTSLPHLSTIVDSADVIAALSMTREGPPTR